MLRMVLGIASFAIVFRLLEFMAFDYDIGVLMVSRYAQSVGGKLLAAHD